VDELFVKKAKFFSFQSGRVSEQHSFVCILIEYFEIANFYCFFFIVLLKL